MFRCFTNPKGLLLLGLVTAGAAYLVFWHGAHLAAVAPLLLVLACPLMHVFMHRGHHGHRHRSPKATDGRNTATKED